MSGIACPQCGRRIAPRPDGSVACPSCGWTSAPSTVGAGQAAPSTATTTTAALPTAMGGLGAAPTDDSSTRPIPPQPITAALPASPQPLAAVVPPEGTSSASGLRAVGIGAIVVVLLAIIALAVLTANGVLPFAAATPTPTPTARPTSTSTLPAGFQRYTAAGYYSIAYPPQWNALTIPTQATPTAGAQAAAIEEFIDLQGNTLMVVDVNSTPQPPAPAAVDASVLRAFSKGPPTNVQGPDSTTVGGVSWVREQGQVTLSLVPGQSQAVVLTTLRGDLTYTIFYAAPVGAFATATAGFFQPMLQSFAFAS